MDYFSFPCFLVFFVGLSANLLTTSQREADRKRWSGLFSSPDMRKFGRQNRHPEPTQALAILPPRLSGIGSCSCISLP